MSHTADSQTWQIHIYFTSHKSHVHILIIMLLILSTRHLFENHRHLQLYPASIHPYKARMIPAHYYSPQRRPQSDSTLSPFVSYFFTLLVNKFELFVSTCGSDLCVCALLISTPPCLSKERVCVSVCRGERMACDGLFYSCWLQHF